MCECVFQGLKPGELALHPAAIASSPPLGTLDIAHHECGTREVSAQHTETAAQCDDALLHGHPSRRPLRGLVRMRAFESCSSETEYWRWRAAVYDNVSERERATWRGGSESILGGRLRTWHWSTSSADGLACRRCQQRPAISPPACSPPCK